MAVPGFLLAPIPVQPQPPFSLNLRRAGDAAADQTVVRRQVRVLRRKSPTRGELTVSLGSDHYSLPRRVIPLNPGSGVLDPCERC
jgi:hypothetical protein